MSTGWRLLIIGLVLFNAFAFLRALPDNIYLKENAAHVNGDTDRSVKRVFDIATRNAEKPFPEILESYAFHGRNPGMFMVIAELFVRAGFSSPLPLQIMSILMFNGGLVCFFLWTSNISESDLVAGIATFFLAISRQVLMFSSSIHAHPYQFLFFNLCILSMCLYADSVRPRLSLGVAWASYFVVCSNYWMYYASTFLMAAGVLWVKKRWSWRTLAVLGTAPMAAVSLLVASMVARYDDLRKAYFRIAEIFVARTWDRRIEGTTWFPNKKFVRQSTWENYHRIVNQRVEDFFYLSLPMLLLMALAAAVLLRGRQNTKLLLIAIPAALSWNVIMIQHTVIHKFTGAYGYFAWMLVIGYFAAAVIEACKSAPRRAVALFGAIVAIGPVALLWMRGFWEIYVKNFLVYVTNLAA